MRDDEQRRLAQSQFGRAATHYLTDGALAGGSDLEMISKVTNPKGTEVVADVGSGAGHTALAMATRVRKVIATDLTIEMIEQVKRLAAAHGAKNITAVVADAEALPYADDSLDIVTCRYAAHHFLSPTKAIAEVARVLKPGGQMLLVDTVGATDPTIDSFVATVELMRDPSHVRNHTVSDWQSMLQSAGLVPVKIAEWDLPLDFEEWVARMHTPEDVVDSIRDMLRKAPESIASFLCLKTEGRWRFCHRSVMIKGRKPA